MALFSLPATTMSEVAEVAAMTFHMSVEADAVHDHSSNAADAEHIADASNASSFSAEADAAAGTDSFAADATSPDAVPSDEPIPPRPPRPSRARLNMLRDSPPVETSHNEPVLVAEPFPEAVAEAPITEAVPANAAPIAEAEAPVSEAVFVPAADASEESGEPVARPLTPEFVTERPLKAPDGVNLLTCIGISEWSSDTGYVRIGGTYLVCGITPATETTGEEWLLKSIEGRATAFVAPAEYLQIDLGVIDRLAAQHGQRVYGGALPLSPSTSVAPPKPQPYRAPEVDQSAQPAPEADQSSKPEDETEQPPRVENDLDDETPPPRPAKPRSTVALPPTPLTHKPSLEADGSAPESPLSPTVSSSSSSASLAVPAGSFANPAMRGWLSKPGPGAITSALWKKRWVVCDGGRLYYYKKREDNEACGVIPLAGYTVETIAGGFKKNAFKIARDGAREYLFAADSAEEKDKWVAAIADGVAAN